MAEPSAEPSARPSPLEGVCRALSFAVPWSVAVWHTSPTADFPDDVALVRAFGLVPVGFEGLVSAALGSAAALVPLGDRVLRASLVSALGLAVCGALLYGFALRLIRARGTWRRTDALLALALVLASLLGPTCVLSGSRPGGAALAVALALATLTAANRLRGPGGALAVGALLAATALESRATGAALLVALAAEAWLGGRRPAQRSALFGFAGAACVLCVPLALGGALVSSPSSNAALAFGGLGRDLGFDPAAVDRSAALSAWLREVGFVGAGLAVLGLGVGLSNGVVRKRLVAWAVFVGLDLCVGTARVPPTETSSFLGVHLLAFAALAVATALGAHALVDGLERLRIPFARAANTLLTVYAFSLLFVSAEDGTRAAEARDQRSAPLYTEAALAVVPAHGALLVRSESWLLRLHAARLLEGARPDLLVVPLERLRHEKIYAELVARESGLLPLVREVLLAGRPSEYALSVLADARPTYLELGADTDQRLHGHLVPRPFFAEVSAHPVARSDRNLGNEAAEAGAERVLSALRKAPDGDPATRALLEAELRERALLLASLGDRDVAAKVVAELLALDPDSAIGLGLKRRLAGNGKGRIDVSGLVAVR